VVIIKGDRNSREIRKMQLNNHRKSGARLDKGKVQVVIKMMIRYS
jgi:hypothetical protein